MPPATGWIGPRDGGREVIDIGSIIGRTFDTVGREWSLFLVLAAPAALGALAQSLIAPPATMSEPASSELLLDDLGAIIVATIVAALFSLISVLAVTAATDELWRGRAAGVGGAFAHAVRALPRYLAVTILFGLVIAALVATPVALVLASPGAAAGLVVLFALVALVLLPVLLWISARLMLLVPVIVLDPDGVTGSIRRAWELSRGHALLLFALSLAIGVIGAMPLWGATLFASFVPSALVGGIALAISTLVYQPLAVIAMTIAWGDRIGGRHADSDVMARGRGRGTGALLVFGLSLILFVIGIGVAAQYAATDPTRFR